MTNGRTGSEWIVVGALAGSSIAGVLGAIIGGIIGAAVSEMRRCGLCGGSMQKIQDPTTKQTTYRCTRCGRWEGDNHQNKLRR